MSTYKQISEEIQAYEQRLVDPSITLQELEEITSKLDVLYDQLVQCLQNDLSQIHNPTNSGNGED